MLITVYFDDDRIEAIEFPTVPRIGEVVDVVAMGEFGVLSYYVSDVRYEVLDDGRFRTVSIFVYQQIEGDVMPVPNQQKASHAD